MVNNQLFLDFSSRSFYDDTVKSEKIKKSTEEKIMELFKDSNKFKKTLTLKQIASEIKANGSFVNQLVNRLVDRGDLKLVKLSRDIGKMKGTYQHIKGCYPSLKVIHKNSNEYRKMKLTSVPDFCRTNKILSCQGIRDRIKKFKVPSFYVRGASGYQEYYRLADLQEVVQIPLKSKLSSKDKILQEPNFPVVSETSASSCPNKMSRSEKCSGCRKKALKFIEDHPHTSFTSKSLSKLIGIGMTQTNKILKLLRKSKKIVIVEFTEINGACTPVYSKANEGMSEIHIIEENSQAFKELNLKTINNFSNQLNLNSKVKHLLSFKIKEMKVPFYYIKRSTGYVKMYKLSDLNKVFRQNLNKHKSVKEEKQIHELEDQIPNKLEVTNPVLKAAKDELTGTTFNLFGFQINIKRKKTLSNSGQDFIGY